MGLTKIVVAIVGLIIVIVVAIAVVTFLKSKNDVPADNIYRYITHVDFEQNLKQQHAMVAQTLAQLRELGIGENQKLKLESLFYTNTAENAEALARALQQQGYRVDADVVDDEPGSFYVGSESVPIKMDQDSIVQWQTELITLGFEHDAAFDGWGVGVE